MEDFDRWLANRSIPSDEDLASVLGLHCAAVAHTQFVSIHPFIDGNGRVARLIMNLFLMRYGYPIAIITKEDRLRYYNALEESQSSDLTAFTALLAECIEESLEEYERAADEQREQQEWAQSLAQKFTRPEMIRVRNEYEVWRNAMELFKSYIKQTVDNLNQESAGYGDVSFNDFGNLAFEKYSALRFGESAKRTWSFRIEFLRGNLSVRYLFFFGYGSHTIRKRCSVTLHIAREEPPNSYNYERLRNIDSTSVPNLTEIGYDMEKERFVICRRTDRSFMATVEQFGKKFFEEIVGLC